MDLSKLSESDLRAIEKGDLRMMSEEGLRLVAGSSTPQAAPEGPSYERRMGAAAAKAQPVRAGFINAAQGPLANFADEAGARVSAGIDRFITGRNPGFTYDQLVTRYRDVARGASEQFQQDNPVLAPALQIGAALGTSVGLARGAPVAPMIAPASAAGRIGAAAGAGAVSGAIGGAGSAETLADVPAEAAKGGALGAVTGGALNAVQQGGGALGRNIIARGANTSVVQDRLRDSGVGGGAARFVARNADELARSRVATALTRDDRTTGQTAARLNTLGDDATLAVSGGKNTRDLLDTMAIMPGRTGNAVEKAIRAQQSGRAANLIGALEEKLGTGGMRLSQTLTGLDEMRSAAAKPMYDAIRGATVQVDDELARLLERAKPAFGDAKRLAELSGDTFDLPDAMRAVQSARRAPTTMTTGLVDPPAPPTVRLGQLDTLKRTLYDMEQANINPETGRLNEVGNAIKNLRKAIVAKADDATRDASGRSAYEAARNVYAGPSELRAAATLGASVITKPGWKIDDLTAGMGDAEMQAFRIGAMEALRDKLGRQSGQTEIMKMWREPATQERLKAIFPDIRSYREFAAEVARESRKSLEGIGRGSQTASRDARMDDEGAAFLTNALEVGTAAKTGNLLGIGSALKSVYGRTVMPEPVRDQIGAMLLQRGPQAQGLLGDLSRFVEQEQTRRAAAAARTGLLGGVGINSLLGN